MPPKLKLTSFYFVCVSCNAKLFADEKSVNCPRCGSSLHSRERRTHPWSQGKNGPFHRPADLGVDDRQNKLLQLLLLVLRHRPERLFVTVEEEGWVDIEQLRIALHFDSHLWRGLTATEIVELAKDDHPMRFEVKGGRIRARYGHSIARAPHEREAVPPSLLLHGTCEIHAISILAEGLIPLGRNFVHLTTDRNYASLVARSKGGRPTNLRVDAVGAANEGVRFWNPYNHVWLADPIAAKFVSRDSK